MSTSHYQLLSEFPHEIYGVVKAYAENSQTLPAKIVEMGLLPETRFRILYQAPFQGPLYIEFGVEKSRIALRKEYAKHILVEKAVSEENMPAFI